jgi:hypothetical protein
MHKAISIVYQTCDRSSARLHGPEGDNRKSYVAVFIYGTQIHVIRCLFFELHVISGSRYVAGGLGLFTLCMNFR